MAHVITEGLRKFIAHTPRRQLTTRRFVERIPAEPGWTEEAIGIRRSERRVPLKRNL